VEINITWEELRKRKLFVATPCYGGNCGASYTQALVQLGILCQAQGIQMQLSMLSNESLVTRARAYQADMFLRTDCTHMLFIDADVSFNPESVLQMLALQSDDSPYDILCGAYPKKCFHNKTKVITEDGSKFISSIVKEKYTGKVLSLNKNNALEYKPITNHWFEHNKVKKKWVSVNTVKQISSNIQPRACVIVTEDHELGYIEDVLDSETLTVKYAQARDMVGKYIVKTPKEIKPNVKSHHRYNLLNKDQVSVLIGAALGDGCVTGEHYVAGHGKAQMAYNKFKHDIIGGRFHDYPDAVENNHNRHSFVNGQTQAIHDLIYENKQKTIKHILPYFNEISLAFMYMDDGNRYVWRSYDCAIPTEDTNQYSWWSEEDESGTTTTVRQAESPGDTWTRGRTKYDGSSTASLATMSFTYDDNLLLVEHFKSKFDIDSFIYKQGPSYGLKFDKVNTYKLHKLIAPYVPECMEYKIDEKYRGGEKYKFNITPLDICAEKVYTVSDYIDNNGSGLFDIEVADNNNLFVNDGVLAHNCISWEKIVQAVNKGVGEENPQDLENYVGDFVFNVAPGQTEFKLDEPVEVSESGTGFMMIRRATFDKFAAAHPELSYKPDHVRTAEFDGSREITMFFDAAIDPESRRYLSEDYLFCKLCRDIGMKVWIAPWVKLQHFGNMIFGGSLPHLASIGANMTADVSQLRPEKKQPIKANKPRPIFKPDA
jgi:hypothetical protein